MGDVQHSTEALCVPVIGEKEGHRESDATVFAQLSRQWTIAFGDSDDGCQCLASQTYGSGSGIRTLCESGHATVCRAAAMAAIALSPFTAIRRTEAVSGSGFVRFAKNGRNHQGVGRCAGSKRDGAILVSQTW